MAGDIPGYTKVNSYRDWGDILQLNYDTPIGIAKVGGWYEHSGSHRYRYDYDFTKGAAAGGISNYNFSFAIMNNGANWNYKEKNTAANTMLNGQLVPAYIKYDEYTSWDQIQGFGELAFKLLQDRLTITPGVKVQDFTRKIDTPIASQSARVGVVAKESYKPTLPYASVNYLFQPNFSAYAQFAKGFLIPSLSLSLETSGKNNATVPLNPAPTRTTNYQTGVVYAGNRLNIDADYYYIEASNSTYVDPTNSNIVTQNANPAHYQGVEGQVSYVLVKGLTAIANATLMTSKDAVTHLWLLNAPNYTAMVGAVYNSGRFKLSYLHKFTGRQWTNIDPVTPTKNAWLSPYSFGVLSGSVTFGSITAGVTVNNPLNSRPATSQSSGAIAPSTLYIYQAPASYEAQIKVRF